MAAAAASSSLTSFFGNGSDAAEMGMPANLLGPDSRIYLGIFS